LDFEAELAVERRMDVYDGTGVLLKPAVIVVVDVIISVSVEAIVVT
jgi:hypothetical protein